ncbi:MAG: RNA methyltransferase [Parafilimonas sp.]|nr:RNA methyltransferase [Parafilimonas sp.]
MLSRNEVKYIQTLRHKKNRDEENVFVAEGVKIAGELLQSGFNIQKIYAVKSWIDQHPGLKNVVEVSENELKRISNFETPNKIVAIVEKNRSVQIPSLKGKITLMLDGIQDPGNLGTIIRTADWFGIENIIASNDTADLYNPKVIQSTMGSFARVNVLYTGLSTFLSGNNITVIGATLDGDNVSAIKKMNECIIIIGNEGKGIRKEIEPFVQKKISIPKTGNAESLNAAVATGILLFQLKLAT